jgi:hypothetical protein
MPRRDNNTFPYMNTGSSNRDGNPKTFTLGLDSISLKDADRGTLRLLNRTCKPVRRLAGGQYDQWKLEKQANQYDQYISHRF